MTKSAAKTAWVVLCGTCGEDADYKRHIPGTAFYHLFDPKPELISRSTPKTELTVEAARDELMRMFPHSMLYVSASAGNDNSEKPVGWSSGDVQIDGHKFSADSLNETMNQVRTWAKSRATAAQTNSESG